MQSYQAARGLFGFLGFCSWLVIITGGLAAFGGLATATTTMRDASIFTSLLWTAPGLMLAIVGLYGLALIQMGRAGVDTAEYTQQMLKVTRDHFEHSKRTFTELHQTGDNAAGYNTTPSAPLENISFDTEEPETGYASLNEDATAPAPTLIEFQGKTIEQTETGFVVEDQTFPLLEDAKSFVLSVAIPQLQEAVPEPAKSNATIGYTDLVTKPEPAKEIELDQAEQIAPPPDDGTIRHNGAVIEEVEGGYRVNDDFFASLDDAKQVIDNPNLRLLLAGKQPT